MVLPGFWFGVIAVLWAGFFLLEGFDFGVGMLLPFLARSEAETTAALRTIGPVWDGNEVWLLVAGGATFAAFPEWYASAFSGLYLPLALVLVGLILRGVSIEYRHKVATPAGRTWCERGVVAGSLLPALLLGVAFADFIRGLRMDATHHVIGGFWDLVSPYGLLGGLVSVGLFAFHGAVFLALRTDGVLRERARSAVAFIAGPLVAVAVAFLAASYVVRGDTVTAVLSVVIAAALLAAVAATRAGRDGWAFVASAVTTMVVPVFVFASLWPDVLPARNHPAWSLTVHNASSSHYTLVVMTVVAVAVTPVVLAYQMWTYWVFRARVTGGQVPTPHLKLRPGGPSADAAYQVPGHPASRVPGSPGVAPADEA